MLLFFWKANKVTGSVDDDNDDEAEYKPEDDSDEEFFSFSQKSFSMLHAIIIVCANLKFLFLYPLLFSFYQIPSSFF